MKYTALPWTVERWGDRDMAIYSESRTRRIATVEVYPREFPEDLANAAFIAQAVNSHDALVAALKNIVTCWGHGYRDKDLLLRALGELIEEDVRAALAMARGEQS